MSGQLFCKCGEIERTDKIITCAFVGGKLNGTHVEYRASDIIATYENDEEYMIFYLDKSFAIFVEKKQKTFTAVEKICEFLGKQLSVY